MKALVTTLALTFTLAVCHAQTFKWELAVPIADGGPVTTTPVVPDSGGGGALVIREDGPKTLSCVWFNSQGAITGTNAIALRTAGGGGDNRLSILRVTPKTLDLEAEIRDMDGLRHSTLRRLQPKKPLKETTLVPDSGDNLNEHVASLPPSAPDKRGFFTVQINVTNVVVRRYTF